MTTARGLTLGARAALAQHQPALEEKELLEDQPPLRRRAEAVQLLEVGLLRRKVRLTDRGSPVDQPLALAHRGRQRIGRTSGSCASAWCTSTRCIFVVTVPVFS